MATSQAMSVPEVVTAYEALRPVIKHFEQSTKSKEKLDAAISILDLKQIKLISWGGTKMAHFVSACKQFTSLLPAVYDAMYTNAIKKEERDALFTVENIFVIITLAYLKPFFKDNFLRRLDTDVLLASAVYRTSLTTTENLGTVQADNFINDISFDQYSIWKFKRNFQNKGGRT